MSKVTEQDSSDLNDGMFYSNNSDLGSIYSGTIEKDSENSKSDLFSEEVDERDTTNLKQEESWLGKRLKSNLSHYDGKLKLSNNFESKIPQHSSSIDFFAVLYIRINFLYCCSIKSLQNSNQQNTASTYN